MLLGALVLACRPAAEPADTPEPPAALVVLAASSLTDVLPEVAEAWHERSGVAVTFSFDGSSRLARQVEAGAPADVVFFADHESMDALGARVLQDSRRDLLGNRLVAVVPAGADGAPTGPEALADVRVVHLALAGENVPAGRYARAALAAAGAWDAVAPRVVTGDNVRTTLAWVTRGEAEVGVVYATDARAEPGVRTAFVFPDDSHPPIVYPAAVVAASAHPEEARAFLAFCAGPEAGARFAEAGFVPLVAR